MGHEARLRAVLFQPAHARAGGATGQAAGVPVRRPWHPGRPAGRRAGPAIEGNPPKMAERLKRLAGENDLAFTDMLSFFDQPANSPDPAARAANARASPPTLAVSAGSHPRPHAAARGVVAGAGLRTVIRSRPAELAGFTAMAMMPACASRLRPTTSRSSRTLRRPAACSRRCRD